jgi:hypothetical protein
MNNIYNNNMSLRNENYSSVYLKNFVNKYVDDSYKNKLNDIDGEKEKALNNLNLQIKSNGNKLIYSKKSLEDEDIIKINNNKKGKKKILKNFYISLFIFIFNLIYNLLLLF